MSKSTQKIGRQGEALAAAFLTRKDYAILARNYRFARGEIDIVARKDDVLVFVEVKTAASTTFGEPETWVTERKQQQIGRVAERYLQQEEIEEVDCRFDVIAVQVAAGEWKIKHIENAFWL
ncbi:MAG: YraN family protein [bacterium]